MGIDDEWRARLALMALAVVLGAVVGSLTAAVTPPFAIAGIIGLLLGMAMLLNTQIGLLTIVGVACLLPFAVIPLPIGTVKLTFLDATLTILLLVWLIRFLTHPGQRLQTSPLDLFILLFIFLAGVSFVLGTGYSDSPEITRLFLKLINSILLFFGVLNCVRTKQQLQQVLLGLVLAGSVAALIGLVLYFLPTAMTVRLMSSLRVIGYPSGWQDILRYIAGTKILRANGTSIDPNILGATLMLTGSVAVTYLVSRSPLPALFGKKSAWAALAKRWGLAVLFTLIVACLLLTRSRSAWVGLAAATIFVATVKYRRLWVLFVLLGAALYFGLLPQAEPFLGHLESGFMAQDKAAAMRLGEYKDAFRLIATYPWFGVGFGAAPSIDLYIGVSSIYLLMAEEMGLIGLAVFLLIMGLLFWHGLRVLNRIPDAELQTILLSCLAAMFGALTTGLFDHHFFNLRFPHAIALFWLFVGLTMVSVRLGQMAIEERLQQVKESV
ncbi:MAG: O-antigen ligase family protein [Chloroflexi bacterium]|nr:O-antigen ligase family protein [Chloroflexota bacterium]MCL5075342.1 O-antigen ligase family protein [Chloroflexota bacterium]